MASIFTYEPDPPGLLSPWSGSAVKASSLPVQDDQRPALFAGLTAPEPDHVSSIGLEKLDPEPQEGPNEYKLHLLLRPRRSAAASSTQHVSGSFQSKHKTIRAPLALSVDKSSRGSPSMSPSLQSRQNRLHHLTTQLLWRLQQSSPYHSSSAIDLVVPSLPETTSELGPPSKLERLLPGLAESQGALYEIGVSDDGALIGLTYEEMEESLMNLRAMAASLGCSVQILRAVIVGECDWIEPTPQVGEDSGQRLLNQAFLWVVEALVFPETLVLTHRASARPSTHKDDTVNPVANSLPAPPHEDSRTEQLRISLTGSSTCGKSSLLGTLSTSTLDNGRGKSRLSLLKHRHEIASGVTSSVAPELVGYLPMTDEEDDNCARIINYACGNVESWNDVHNTAEGGRLVLLTDSAGHPRFRRTIVRGLVSWSPHWMLCCIAADGSHDQGVLDSPHSSIATDSPGVDGTTVDSSKAHLALCLKLRTPLVIAITKYDLASKSGLRETLSRTLTAIKATGRKPVLLRPGGAIRLTSDLQSILCVDQKEASAILDSLNEAADNVVPIVLTSSVTGLGITKLHALLQILPLPKPRHLISYQEPHLAAREGVHSKTVFHIDDVYIKSKNPAPIPHEKDANHAILVLSGLVHRGEIALGDRLLAGPFEQETAGSPESKVADNAQPRSYPARVSTTPTPFTTIEESRHLKRFINGMVNGSVVSSNGTLTPVEDQMNSTHGSVAASEWLKVSVISVRNLRLPVRTLLPDQVGTIGVRIDHGASSSIMNKFRKGMVLLKAASDWATKEQAPIACSGLRAQFTMDDYHVMEPGAAFTLYFGSVRAAARITSVEAVGLPSPFEQPTRHGNDGHVDHNEADAFFNFEADVEDEHEDYGHATANARGELDDGQKCIEVSFMLARSREWAEVRTRLLVMPSIPVEGGVGLDGFVGNITAVIA